MPGSRPSRTGSPNRSNREGDRLVLRRRRIDAGPTPGRLGSGGWHRRRPLRRGDLPEDNPGSRFVTSDLRSLTDDDIRCLAGSIPGRELLLAGCVPCQAFSKQRSQHGVAARSDADLLMEFGRLARALRPAVVLMENVPGIAFVEAFRVFLKTLHDSGYDCDHRVLNARDFSVPQHRQRYVLLAVYEGAALLPRSAGNDPLRDSLTVRSAIGHFPSIEAGESHRCIPNHHAARLSPLNLERVRATPANGGGRLDWPEHLELACHRRPGLGFSDVYGRMWWDREAPTLTSRCNSLSNGRFGHPEQDRAISLREAAAIQTFPDDCEFFGAKNRIARWIGNAVPVSFAEALGNAASQAIA